MLVRISEIVDDRLCCELRWSEGIKYLHCGSFAYWQHGHHNSTEYRLRSSLTVVNPYIPEHERVITDS